QTAFALFYFLLFITSLEKIMMYGATCFSLKERLAFFFFLLFSLLLVLACGFSLVCFLTKSLRSVRRVSLSDFGFLCSLSMFLSDSSSPLKF
uniref:Uncharacterized protein n=1 Tax=Fundulus heteroclitus TaxID=8078 RepID=A0A3Q2Q9N0_FUNHE